MGHFIDDRPTEPCMFIQWKGTDVCGDITCSCGARGHVDTEFLYFVQCPKCNSIFEVGCFVALRPATPERLKGVSDYAIKTWEVEVEDDLTPSGGSRTR